MNLEVFLCYLRLQVESESQLESDKEKLTVHLANPYLFFKLISPRSAPEIDARMLRKFLDSFDFKLLPARTDKLNANFKCVPSRLPATASELMELGIMLFMKQWGQSGKLNFENWRLFLKGSKELPKRTYEVEDTIKKYLFELLLNQMQCLIDNETLKEVVATKCKNIQDLFYTIAIGHFITQQALESLLLRSGERVDREFIRKLGRRFPLPCNLAAFKDIFQTGKRNWREKKQIQIFYPAVRERKDELQDQNRSAGKFFTPARKTAANGSQTKETNTGTLVESVSVHQLAVPAKQILEYILEREQQLIQLKRELIFKEDYDLELIYERMGILFEGMLNRRYGSCNFTSFVRFMVPHDEEQKCLAFIKYVPSNYLTESTKKLVMQLLVQEQINEQAIAALWGKVDRQMLFRRYCLPKDKVISRNSLKSEFTDRDVDLLFDRMGCIQGGVSFDKFR